VLAPSFTYKCLIIYSSWPCVTPHDPAWPCMTLHDPTWPCVTLHNLTWPNVGTTEAPCNCRHPRHSITTDVSCCWGWNGWFSLRRSVKNWTCGLSIHSSQFLCLPIPFLFFLLSYEHLLLLEFEFTIICYRCVILWPQLFSKRLRYKSTLISVSYIVANYYLSQYFSQ